jgi:hypothetical protein
METVTFFSLFLSKTAAMPYPSWRSNPSDKVAQWA